MAGPLHPAADAVIMVVPNQAAVKVTLPVAGTIVIPAETLAASRE